jgi:hypothetical protein
VYLDELPEAKVYRFGLRFDVIIIEISFIFQRTNPNLNRLSHYSSRAVSAG